jgi:hypothetical protein
MPDKRRRDDAEDEITRHKWQISKDKTQITNKSQK